MTSDQRISAFSRLGTVLGSLGEEELDSLAHHAQADNPWFTPDNVRRAVKGITYLLDSVKLRQWISKYDLEYVTAKTIGLVMAGNIPLVGFHDLLCVLTSGHQALVKLSSKDSYLVRYVIDQLLLIEPGLNWKITLQPDQLRGFDAVIATGSDNSARYFEYYFKKYPHIIRKNRTSTAILAGTETNTELQTLGDDVFSYFGLGCRNVSKLFVPAGYDFKHLLDCWNSYSPVIHHHKYANNYDYQKSILLVNRTPFLDNGFIVLQENEKLVSPISVLYYQFYNDTTHLSLEIKKEQRKLQCVVGNMKPASIPFGKAQLPEVWDYADHIDTMKFLTELT